MGPTLKFTPLIPLTGFSAMNAMTGERIGNNEHSDLASELREPDRQQQEVQNRQFTQLEGSQEGTNPDHNVPTMPNLNHALPQDQDQNQENVATPSA